MDDLIERLDHIALNVLDDRDDAQAVCDANARIAALEADKARLMGLVKEAGDRLSMLLYHKTPAADDCYSFRLTAEHIRWANATLAKIKEATDA